MKMSLCMTAWKISCEKLKFLRLCGHLKAIMWVFPLVLNFSNTVGRKLSGSLVLGRHETHLLFFSQ